MGFLLHCHRLSLIEEAAVYQVESGAAVRRIGTDAVFYFQALGKQLAHTVLTMHYKYFLRLLRKALHPIQQSVLVRMTAHTGKLHDLRTDFDRLTKQLNLLGSLHNCTPESTHCLISYKKYGTFRPP